MVGKQVLGWLHKVMVRCPIVLVVFPVVPADMAVQIQCKGVMVVLLQALVDTKTKLAITAVTRVDFTQGPTA